MKFEVISSIESIEVISVGTGIRNLGHLERAYGPGRWRKLKGIARVRFPNGNARLVELHWREAHGIERKNIKIKRYVE